MGVVAELEPQLGRLEGRPAALDGGITNRNYRVRLGSCDCVVRVTGAGTAVLGIDREAERLAGERAAELGIAPRMMAAGPGYVVTEYVQPAGRAEIEAVAAALRAFHGSGLRLPVRFWVPELLGRYAAVAGVVPPAFERARAVVARIAERLPLEHPVPCHNDLLPGNVLAADGRVILVDWEYAGMGHRCFDLGNFAVNHQLGPADEDALLAAYFQEAVTDARRAGLALMRIVSDAREAAWGVVQAEVSELDFDFSAYAHRHFERMERAAGDPRFQEWLDAAAA